VFRLAVAERDALGLPPQTPRLVREQFFQSGVPEAKTMGATFSASPEFDQE
jgi:hypothetical protein